MGEEVVFKESISFESGVIRSVMTQEITSSIAGLKVRLWM
jgi:hypothetical protein